MENNNITKYNKLFIELSKKSRCTESAHMIEDEIYRTFISDIANGRITPEYIIILSKQINEIIIEGRKNVGRWYA